MPGLPSTHGLDEPALKLVCFALAGQAFGAPIVAVKETIPLRPLTRVFLVPPFIAGLINLRGEVVAVLDLIRLLDLPPPAERGVRDPAILILRPNAAAGPRAAARAACGLLVDQLLGVRELAADSVAPAPSTLKPETAGYLRGVAAIDDPPRPLLYLDPERILGAERLRPFARRKT